MIKYIGKKSKVLWYSLFAIILVILNFIASSQLVNSDFPWYSNISIFLLVNINIILLLVLLIVIFRKMGKLLLDQRKNVFGTKLQSKLVIFSIILTVIPVAVVFTFSNAIINNSIDKWFNAQVELALKNSIDLMQRYQNQVEQDIIEQTSILSKLITSKGFLLHKNYDEMAEFVRGYMKDNRIRGIGIYNNQKTELISIDKNIYLSIIIGNEELNKVLSGSQVAQYKFFSNNQVYWVGQPISSTVNNNIILGALFVYKTVPAQQAEKVSRILESYNNYRQIKFYSKPIENSYKILLVMMTLLVVFAGIWGSLLFAKSITDPLEKLTSASHQVSEGNLDVVLDKAGNDEVGFLVESFNDMTQKLRLHNEELKKKNEILSEMYNQISKDNQYIDTIFKNVKSSIFLLNSKLEILKVNRIGEKFVNPENQFTNEKLKKYLNNFIKSEDSFTNFQTELSVNGDNRTFTVTISKILDRNNLENIVLVLDDISEVVRLQRINIWREIATRIAHEIKNPLTPIKLSAERMLRKVKKLDDTEMKQMLEESMSTVINEANELYNLVNEFNSFARLPEIKKEYFNISKLVDSVVFIYQQSHPNINFHKNIDESLEIYADKQQIKRMFLNLINNSIHALNDNGNIYIDVFKDKNWVKVVFKDDGAGIDKNDLEKIFMPYFSKKPDGTGLGLAIVKKIIEEHSGSIKIDSEKNKYTTFNIKLPYAQVSNENTNN
ncbi:integral membrane sensor signal transduction histidine kinase [Flexistipes sinusarabici DSM 4947]|uniref:histidine kinase n=1 Tax=Flexistipes sinusarabici (strain ATCC 49648 / DSM 4947 / MAS 10) TaxID=717231 RepID=F8E706_FLESM|nr:ATP-binding protein [Flexistipes sinusarabici]AEI14869.1 integral membrane sensor signal transduction histidine kinase [Flexistipes sinusarabici DSM 4947]